MKSLLSFPTGRRSKWVVLAIWIAVLAAVGPFAGRLFDVTKDNRETYLPGSAESTRVLQLQENLAGQVSPVVVLYARADGITEADRARAAADLEALAGRFLDGDQPPPLVPSDDGQALLATIPVSTEGARDVGIVVPEAVAEIRATVGDDGDGLDITVTGPGGLLADQAAALENLEGALLIGPVLVVAVLLLLIYRSAVLWLIPLAVVFVGNGLATAVVYGLVTNLDLTISGLGAGVLGVLVYGAGTDFALLLIARYREELHRHPDHHQAMRTAVRRSAPAIIASAGTTSLGLLSLLVADQNSTRGLGPIGLIALTAAVLAMLTLLPTVLSIFGRRVFWPAIPEYNPAARAGDAEHVSGLWQRVARLVGRRHRLIWTTSALALGVLALGLTGLRTPAQDLFRDDPDSVVGMEAIAGHYPAGQSTPLEIVTRADHVEEVAAAISQTPGVAEVAEVGHAGELAGLTATLAAEPGSDAETGIIDTVRDRAHAVDGAEALVGGPSAVDLDLTRTNVRDAQVVIPLVLVVVLVVLAALLRALVAPLLLIASVVLSFAASFGLSVWVFEQVLGWQGLDSSLPLIAFVFLVALGVDYNIFLMSRVQEETRRLGTTLGTLHGLAVTGSVITSAGLVLAGTFAVLFWLPLLMVAQLGFVVAVGVLIDTILVRSLLVPALTVDVGPRVWWPSRLAHAAAPQHTPDEPAPSLTDTPAR